MMDFPASFINIKTPNTLDDKLHTTANTLLQITLYRNIFALCNFQSFTLANIFAPS